MIRYASASEIASDALCEIAVPNASSNSDAIAGSPRKPMPSEVIVMPSWQADRYSSMCSICLRTSAAPRRPSSTSCSTRPWRRAHERELRGDEQAVQRDQNGDAEQEEQLGHRRPALHLTTSRRIVVAHALTRPNVAVSQAPQSGARARNRRRSGRPRCGCVTVTVTVFHEISRSGWWFMSSASGVSRLTKSTDPLKSPLSNSLDDRVTGALPAVQGLPAARRSPCHSDVPCSSPCVSLHSFRPRPRCCSRSASATAWPRSPTSVTTRPAPNNSPTSPAA